MTYCAEARIARREEVTEKAVMLFMLVGMLGRCFQMKGLGRRMLVLVVLRKHICQLRGARSPDGVVAAREWHTLEARLRQEGQVENAKSGECSGMQDITHGNLKVMALRKPLGLEKGGDLPLSGLNRALPGRAMCLGPVRSCRED
nr:hypothetical protein CFP56_22152 [Quercus suber]